MTAASAGDTIQVADGTWAAVTIDKAVTLVAENEGMATITGPGVNQGAAVSIAAGVGGVTIDGFSITASPGDLAGIYAVANNSGITIQNNSVDGGSAGHAFLAGAGTTGLTNSTITGNSFTGTAVQPVFYINGPASIPGSTASGNTITGNSFGGNPGGGLLAGVESSGGSFSDNTFTGTATYAQLEVFGTGITISGNDFGATGPAFRDGTNSYDAADIVADNTVTGGTVWIEGSGTLYQTINAALTAAVAGDTIVVGPGVYEENLLVQNKTNLTLISADGAETTTIRGSDASGLLGTIQIGANANGLRIEGFTIEGINGNGAIEKGAIYTQNALDGLQVVDNVIVAKGDSGMTAAFGVSFTNALIDGNTFSGQTFTGTQPQSSATNTSSGQFDVGSNFPRQLLVMGNGNGSPASASGVTVTNNTFSGTTGGISSVTGLPYGNTLATIDAADSTITGNTFTGITGTTTTAALRVRQPGTEVEGNTFDLSDGGSFAFPNSIFRQNIGSGTEGPNTYIAADGSQVFIGTSGNDTFVGTSGDDYFFASGGSDVLDGQDGNDTIDMMAAGSSGAFVDLQSGLAFSSVTALDTLVSIENAKGSSGNDALFGNAGDNTFVATAGSDAIDGRGGSDTFDASAATTAVQANLTTGVVSGAFTASLTAIENIATGSGDDSITGSMADNTIAAGAGNDTIAGGGGNDDIDGGAGVDTVVLAGDREDWTITWDGTTATATDGTDTVTITDAGRLQFDDMRVLLVAAGTDFGSIGAALTDAVDGDEIMVGAGTYAEALTVTKAVSIIGANAGLAGTDAGRGAESVIDGTIVISAAAAVTIDGMKFLNDAPVPRAGIDTVLVTTGAGHVIANTVFESAVAGGGTTGRGDVAIYTHVLTTGALTIRDNLFAGDGSFAPGAQLSTAAWSRGIWSNVNGATLTIEGNTFENNRTGINQEGLSDANTTITGNTFLNSGTGIALGVPAAGAVTGITDNSFTNVGTDFNLQNLTGAVSFDAGGSGNAATDAMTILGGAGADSLGGTDGADGIVGNAGNDTITGGDGADALFGGAGNDLLIVDTDDTVINGGADTDTAVFAPGTVAADVIAMAAAFAGVEVIRIGEPGDPATFVVLDGMSIQAAINAAEAGDTIVVGPGTFAGNLTVGKSLTILGANEGIAGDGTRGAESAITGVIDVQAGNVVIDGVAVLQGGTVLGQNAGIYVRPGGSGLTVENTLFERSGSPDGFRGILTETGAVTDVTIADNAFSGWATGVYLNPGSAGATVTGNLFDGNVVGMSLDGPDGDDVSGNTFANSGVEHIGVGALPATVDVGAIIGTNSFDASAKPVTIYGLSGAGQDLTGTGADDVILAGSGNDTITGGAGADELFGGAGNDVLNADTDDTAIDGGAGTDTAAFAAGTDAADVLAMAADITGVEVIRIGEAGAGATFVVLDGMSIQAAIDAAGAGDTIVVGAGIFDGDVTVNKAVTLQGAQSGVAVDDAGRGTGESVIGGRVLVTADGASIDGFTLSKPSTSTSGNGVNFAGWGGNNLTVDADGVSIGNTIVEAFGAAGGFAHSGFVRLAGDGTDFSGNLVRAGSGYNALGDARGVSGVWVNGAAGDAITVVDNQVLVSTNNADGIFVMAGIATVTGNTISGTNGGFVAWPTYGDLVFTGNDISNVTGSSIRILPSSLDPQVTVTGNTIDNDDPITFELSGDSTVEGGDGDDVVNGSGAAAIDFTGGEGDDTYRPGAGGGSFDGGDGSDTLDLALLGGGATVNLSTGQATGSAIGTILLTGVENVTGTTGDDAITGSAGANLLAGGDGNDTLSGMGGTDTLDGGAGTDTADFSASNAAVLANLVLGAAFGADIGNVTLTSVENLIGGAGNDVLMGANTGHMLDGGAGLDTLIGGTGADTLIGGAGADVLTGGEGNDSMDGGFGADTMTGGLGDDTYIVDNVGDVVIEAAGGGIDTVLTARNHTLAAHVENLVLQGSDNRTATGNAENNVLTGNDGNSKLQGLAGNDTLLGGVGDDTLNGGAGADSMAGGLGDDIYYVENQGDVVVELAGEGDDTVFSWRTYTLGDNVENLTLLGTNDRNGTGNAADNVLTGNVGQNILIGGLGNDTIFGNDGDDHLIGNQGDDVLAGGIGADTLTGGLGADVFVFAQADVGTGVDQVSGFAKGQDRIGLSADLVAWLESGGNDALDVLVWNQATSTLSVDLALVGPGGVTYVPSTVDLAVITHNGSLLLTEDDFLFL